MKIEDFNYVGHKVLKAPYVYKMKFLTVFKVDTIYSHKQYYMK